MNPGALFRRRPEILEGLVGMNVIHSEVWFCSRRAPGREAFCSSVWPTVAQSWPSRLHSPRHQLADSGQPGLRVSWFGVVLAGVLSLLGCAEGEPSPRAGSAPADGPVFAGEPGKRAVLIGWRGHEAGSRRRVVCVEPLTYTNHAIGGAKVESSVFVAGLIRTSAVISGSKPDHRFLREVPFRICQAYAFGDISAEGYRQFLKEYPHLLLVLGSVSALKRLDAPREADAAIKKIKGAVLNNAALSQICITQHKFRARYQDDSDLSEVTNLCAGAGRDPVPEPADVPPVGG